MAVKARSMLFDLYGDYVELRQGEIWLGHLVQLGGVLGVSEQAVRSAVTRMVHDGWLTGRRSGRRSAYSLTFAGRRLIAKGRERIFRPQDEHWDGRWSLLTFSIPETQREVRHRVRQELAWLGFGPVGSAVYVSPHERTGDVEELIARYELDGRIQLYRAENVRPGDPRVLVERAWNLKEANERYRVFIDTYVQGFQDDQQRAQEGALGDEHSFVLRFQLVNDFRKFPFIDPGLPPPLHSDGWLGLDARRLFQSYHALLTPGALRYYDHVTGEPEIRRS